MTLSAILKIYYDKIAEKLPNVLETFTLFTVFVCAWSTLALAWPMMRVHPLKVECIKNSDIKMKKYYDKIVEKLPFIVSEAFLVFALALVWAVSTLALPWSIVGVHPLKLDQIIFFISVLSANIISFRFPVWFPSKSRLVEITCEIILFSLSEIAVFVPITMNVYWLCTESGHSICLTETDSRIIPVSIMPLMGYLFVLFPLMNTVIHSAFIYHLICRPKYASDAMQGAAAYSAAVKAVYCILGFILLYGSMLEVLDLSKENAYVFFILLTLLLQAQIFMSVLMQVTAFDEIVKRVKEGKHIEWIDLYPHFRLIFVVIGMMPILISIVIILTNYGATSLVNDINEFNDTVVDRIAFMRELENYQQSSQFGVYLSFWSSIFMSMIWSGIRDDYLVQRIQTQSKTSSLSTEFATYNITYYQN